MRLSTDKLALPTQAQALPGRSEKMKVPASHFVNGARLEPPFPDGTELALFGLGCFWGAERKFWQTPGVVSTPSATPADRRRTRPTARSARGGPVTPRWCASSSIRRRLSYDDLLRVFWEAHDPTQGMRQGNDVGTQYRSAIYTYGDEQREGGAASRDEYQRALEAAGYGRDHHRDPPGSGVLLRRGLPPAVPGEEPRRLLRARRHRRLLPDRARRGTHRLRLQAPRRWRLEPAARSV